METINLELDEQVKKEMKRILKNEGLTINEYFTLAARELVRQRRNPFDHSSISDEPTEETKKALVAAAAKELGILRDDAPGFDSIQNLKNYLDQE